MYFKQILPDTEVQTFIHCIDTPVCNWWNGELSLSCQTIHTFWNITEENNELWFCYSLWPFWIYGDF